MFKNNFSLFDFFMPVLPDFSELEENIQRKKEESRERLSREFYISVGGRVVRMRVEMQKTEVFGGFAGLKCFVTEIDGSAVLPEESLNLSEEINIDGSTQIKQEEGLEVVEKTLGNFKLSGSVRLISDELAQGQIKINSLRKRINENKQRREK
ncbi:MAG: hypothetical protein HYX21_00020 [Candidatus Yanofskybacteria bacterium]|nr:hypothetical protein [Candidatus Yanofskybacteria bacterium]